MEPERAAAGTLPPMTSPVVELENVRKAFAMPGGETVAVLDIERFALDEKEQVALTGQSGSGKSTLLHVISGIMRPDTGRVRIAGHDITRLGEAATDRIRADTLGLVFQQFKLLPGFTALENVLVAMSFGSGKPDRWRAADLLGRPLPSPRSQAGRTLDRPAAAGGRGPGARQPAAGGPRR